jgi:ABC-2 type transport system ATP-binding protein
MTVTDNRTVSGGVTELKKKQPLSPECPENRNFHIPEINPETLDVSIHTGRPVMNAIEVRNIGKVFRKWQSNKARKKDDEKNSTDGSSGNGKPKFGWFQRFIPRRKITTALDGITFDVKSGEIFGLLGPNGSGKSTMIRILSTLLIPDVGEVRIHGKDVSRDIYEVQRLINRVSVDAAFFKKLSAHENLMYTARLYGIPSKSAPARAKDILEKIAFDIDRYHDPLEEFSRGMQQKVAIARALLTSPVVLLLDEPTTGLDPKSKREVQAFIEDVQKTHEATIILTTHDMEEADRLCQRIGIIDKGKIIAMDTSEGLKSMVLDQLNGSAGDKRINNITLEDVFLHLTGDVLKDDEQA